jgi:hypothetical protein
MSLAPPSTLLSAGPILEDIDEEVRSSTRNISSLASPQTLSSRLCAVFFQSEIRNRKCRRVC